MADALDVDLGGMLGPAIVTQLAHVQDTIQRVSHFRQFAQRAAAIDPAAPIVVQYGAQNDLLFIAQGTGVMFRLDHTVLDRAAAMNPQFTRPIFPAGAAHLGVSAATLVSLTNIFAWGLHDPDALVGTVKALGSLFYSTERIDDPLLSHYQQREWRIIGGMKKDGTELTAKVTPELRARLVALDAAFFGREMDLPGGVKQLVDDCEVFAGDGNGGSVLSLARRVMALIRSRGRLSYAA